MKSLRPPLVVLILGTIVVAALNIGVILPLLTSVASRRSETTAQREQLARLQAQQRNIAEVAKEYDVLQEKEKTVNELFLAENRSVDFFNAIDELLAASNATNFQLRIDTPVRSKAYQLLGVHLTFSATYSAAVGVMRGLMNLQELVAITNTSLSGDGTGPSYSVTIDAQVPWSQPL
jgi:hypothetical protein